MDINKTWQDYLDALTEEDLGLAVELHKELTQWTMQGGFAPAGFTNTQFAALVYRLSTADY